MEKEKKRRKANEVLVNLIRDILSFLDNYIDKKGSYDSDFFKMKKNRMIINKKKLAEEYECNRGTLYSSLAKANTLFMCEGIDLNANIGLSTKDQITYILIKDFHEKYIYTINDIFMILIMIIYINQKRKYFLFRSIKERYKADKYCFKTLNTTKGQKNKISTSNYRNFLCLFGPDFNGFYYNEIPNLITILKNIEYDECTLDLKPKNHTLNNSSNSRNYPYSYSKFLKLIKGEFYTKLTDNHIEFIGCIINKLQNEGILDQLKVQINASEIRKEYDFLIKLITWYNGTKNKK